MNTVRTLINQRAESQAGDVFLISPEIKVELNFFELQKSSVEIEQQLLAMGIEKGDKVAFLMTNGLWTAKLFLGTMYSGRVIVPLNAVCGNDHLKYVIDHCDAKILFVEDSLRETYKTVFENLPAKPRVITTCRNNGPEWPVSNHDTAVVDSDVSVNPDDDALLIYTSGTTGRPKGVVLSHKSVIAGGTNTATAHQLKPHDRALCVLQLYHINGEMVTVMGPLVSGSSVVMPNKFSITDFWPLIDDWQCSWFSVVPTIIAYLLEQAERLKQPARVASDHPKLRFGRSASAPLSPEMHRKFEQQFSIPLIETMGLSETAAQILSNPLPPGISKYGSPGIAVGNEAMIIDKQGNEQTIGESGELMIRGDNVMKQYYKNPETTAETIRADDWMHTGDLAYVDEDGYYFITGRLKEIIIKGGENIAPREIDEALYQHSAVLEAAAFAIPDPRYGQEILACVSLKPGAQCTAEELRELCIEKLGKFKTPKSISFMDELPKGPSGKIQRLKLSEAATGK
ncbi:MAG: acyl-CoA synthetase (AMP-forming)/AMP-acid ligase II [Gammaproteobacteria bacterium]|jgi:acyl-CoA synthetase (AMP-forming)/AMP-acid ligase II